MAQQVCVVLNAAEREQLAAIAADRNRPRKHIERARIVLASADRHSAQRVAQSIGVSRPTVWRWRGETSIRARDSAATIFRSMSIEKVRFAAGELG